MIYLSVFAKWGFENLVLGLFFQKWLSKKVSTLVGMDVEEFYVGLCFTQFLPKTHA